MEHLLLISVSNAVTATILAVGVALLSWKIRRPAVLHLLWLLVLLRLLAPPLLDFGVLPAADSTAGVGSLALRPVPADATLAGAPTSAMQPVVLVALSLWFPGSLLIAALIVVRTRRFRRILASGQPPHADLEARVERMADRIGCARLPRVLVVDRQISPMIWSAIAGPVLVLPRGLLDRLSPLQLDTIIAHELAHLKRGDHRVRWMELVAILLFWWNPTTWWACRGIRLSEEECCDVIVLRALPDRVRDYASGLVESVRQMTSPDPWPLDMASPLRRTAAIERRIASMFTPRNRQPLSTPIRATLILVAVIALGLTPLMKARAATPPQEEEISAQPISIDLQDADLGDVLATFAELAEIEILTEPSVKGKVSIKADGEPWDELLDRILRENGFVYSIDDGRIIVRAAGGGEMSPLTRDVSIEGEIDGQPVYRYIEGGKVSEPKRIDGPAPGYPEAARKEGITGAVVLDCVIGTDGRIGEIDVMRSVDDALTQASKDAVEQWVFAPGTLDGEAVAVKYVLTVNFRLE